MPGRSAEDEAWGSLPLVVDTSAWARAGHPEVREAWSDVLLEDRVRLTSATRMEILLSARGGEDFDALADSLDTLRNVQLDSAVVHAAEAGMRDLAHRSAGAQRLPVIDYLVAATAQELGAAVIHYDRDYDTLAEVMSFDSIWLAPAGALP